VCGRDVGSANQSYTRPIVAHVLITSITQPLEHESREEESDRYDGLVWLPDKDKDERIGNKRAKHTSFLLHDLCWLGVGHLVERARKFDEGEQVEDGDGQKEEEKRNVETHEAPHVPRPLACDPAPDLSLSVVGRGGWQHGEHD